ncbi:hypothetical protein ACFL5O_08430 [Myxococcota bacterium]
MTALLEHKDSRAIKAWLAKHIEYAQLEAELRSEARNSRRWSGKLMGEGQAGRVRFLRTQVYDRLPPILRPATYFVYRYLLGRGWRDGLTGTYFHFLHAFWYPLLIDVFDTQNLEGNQQRTTRRH